MMKISFFLKKEVGSKYLCLITPSNSTNTFDLISNSEASFVNTSYFPRKSVGCLLKILLYLKNPRKELVVHCTNLSSKFNLATQENLIRLVKDPIRMNYNLVRVPCKKELPFLCEVCAVRLEKLCGFGCIIVITRILTWQLPLQMAHLGCCHFEIVL